MSNITLYHGSKSGIKGMIQPISRRYCDFGKGFYMGTEIQQPLTLICNYPKAKLYTVEMELDGLDILDIEVGINWALLIALNRGKLEMIKGTPIYRKYVEMSRNKDLIIGYIANDRMFVVLDRFFSGEITDQALIHSLSALKLGKQYVAVSKKACDKITIIEEHMLSEKEKALLLKKNENQRVIGVVKAEEICKKYRREGNFFDEIINGGI